MTQEKKIARAIAQEGELSNQVVVNTDDRTRPKVMFFSKRHKPNVGKLQNTDHHGNLHPGWAMFSHPSAGIITVLPIASRSATTSKYRGGGCMHASFASHNS